MRFVPRSRALRLYLISALAVLLAVTVASVTAVWWAARNEAAHIAEETAQSFARMVASPLRIAEMRSSDPSPSRLTLDRVVADLLQDTEVYRVKIWALDDDDTATVLYSDLGDIEGMTVDVSAYLREAWEEDDAVVLPVPQDEAHAGEYLDGAEALEVYLPFVDADGARAVAELYFVPQTNDLMKQLLSHTLPIAIGAPILLSALTFPLVLRLVRQASASEAKRRALVEEALEVSERERRRLARLLHDGPIQELTAVSLKLEHTPSTTHSAAEDIRAQVLRLRDLLDDLSPLHVEDEGIRAAIASIAANMPEATASVTVSGSELLETDAATRAFVLRCITEFVRNAALHSGCTSIRVHLSEREGLIRADVSDDGIGFDPAPPPSGHHGLHLVRSAIEDAGGELIIASGATGTQVSFTVPHTGDVT